MELEGGPSNYEIHMKASLFFDECTTQAEAAHGLAIAGLLVLLRLRQSEIHPCVNNMTGPFY